MWRAGLDLALVAWVLNALALGVGVFLGARGLIDPHWAARFVRLKADDQGGGFAEFRATYGGVFLGLHGVALLFSLVWITRGVDVIGLFATGASAVLAAAWAGAAGGRTISMWRDGTRTRFNEHSALVEAALAFCIAAPWLLWMVG
ncbi:MAG: hypothetical protein AB7O98_09610 [Hyphomonadaceae bacterium]